MTVPRETIVFCEGYDDRAFWSGFLESRGLKSARNRRDPFGLKVAGGDFGYWRPDGSFVRLRPCHGRDNIKQVLVGRWQLRETRPLERMVLNFDSDAEGEERSREGRDRAAEIVRTLAPETRMVEAWPVCIDGIDIDLVIWETAFPLRPGIPGKQTLERVVCTAILEAYPDRGIKVQRWLEPPPDPYLKSYGWSQMAKWYANHGCTDFFKALWRDPRIADALDEVLSMSGAIALDVSRQVAYHGSVPGRPAARAIVRPGTRTNGLCKGTRGGKMKAKQTRKPSTLRLLAMGFAAGGIGGYLLGRKLALRRSMPYLDLWQRELEPAWGEVKAAVLAARMESRYQTLLAARPRLASRALRFHLEMGILPGVAFYQVMAEEMDDPGEARRGLAAMLAKAVEPLRDAIASLDKFSDPFGAFRNMVRWTIRLTFPPSGWQITTQEDSPQCLAYEVEKCFYRDVLDHYGERELTEVFCDVDDTLFGALPDTITWNRAGTLGRGDPRCDFRWCRTNAHEDQQEAPTEKKAGDPVAGEA